MQFIKRLNSFPLEPEVNWSIGDDDDNVIFTSSRTPTTRKSLSILVIATGRESGWPKVLQASEVPQNQVILKGILSDLEISILNGIISDLERHYN